MQPIITHFSVLLAESEMDTMPWWVWIILIVIMLAAIFWYWINRHAYEPTFEMHPHHDAHGDEDQTAEPQAAPAAIAVETPTRFAEPAVTPTTADDLKIVEGIGPKVQSVLNGIGIFTFKQLAESDLTAVRKALEAAGYRYMDPRSWSDQAALAADGRWDELKLMQENLKAGR